MPATSSLTVDLAVATGAICVMLAAGIAGWRWKPYTHHDFAEAMERICAGVEELWSWANESEGESEDEWEGEGALREHQGFASDEVRARALREKCASMLKDMLRNTCFIVNRADPYCLGGCLGDGRAQQEEREIHRRATEVVRQGTRLIFRLRWTLLRLALRPAPFKTCRQTLRAAAKFASLWMALIRLLEAKYPEFREKLTLVE